MQNEKLLEVPKIAKSGKKEKRRLILGHIITLKSESFKNVP